MGTPKSGKKSPFRTRRASKAIAPTPDPTPPEKDETAAVEDTQPTKDAKPATEREKYANVQLRPNLTGTIYDTLFKSFPNLYTPEDAAGLKSDQQPSTEPKTAEEQPAPAEEPVPQASPEKEKGRQSKLQKSGSISESSSKLKGKKSAKDKKKQSKADEEAEKERLAAEEAAKKAAEAEAAAKRLAEEERLAHENSPYGRMVKDAKERLKEREAAHIEIEKQLNVRYGELMQTSALTAESLGYVSERIDELPEPSGPMRSTKVYRHDLSRTTKPISMASDAEPPKSEGEEGGESGDADQLGQRAAEERKRVKVEEAARSLIDTGTIVHHLANTRADGLDGLVEQQRVRKVEAETEKQKEMETGVVKRNRVRPWMNRMTHTQMEAEMKVIDRMEQSTKRFLPNPRYQSTERPSRALNATSNGGCPFQATPAEVEFPHFELDREYVATVTITNKGGVSRRLRMIPPGRTEFQVALGCFPGDDGSLVAPGMSAQYTVRFVPSTLADTTDEIVIAVEDGSELIVPLRAWRQAPELHIPHEVQCDSTFLYKPSTKRLDVWNSGGPGSFIIVSRSELESRHGQLQIGAWFQEFSRFDERSSSEAARERHDRRSKLRVGDFAVGPRFFELGTGDHAFLDIEFAPSKVGNTREEILLVCDNCEIISVGLKGGSAVPHIVLDEINAHKFDPQKMASVLSFPATVIGSVQQCRLKYRNKCALDVPFRWVVRTEGEDPFVVGLRVSPAEGVIRGSSTQTFTVSYSPASPTPLQHCSIELFLSEVPMTLASHIVVHNALGSGECVQPNSGDPSGYFLHGWRHAVDDTGASGDSNDVRPASTPLKGKVHRLRGSAETRERSDSAASFMGKFRPDLTDVLTSQIRIQVSAVRPSLSLSPPALIEASWAKDAGRTYHTQISVSNLSNVDLEMRAPLGALTHTQPTSESPEPLEENALAATTSKFRDNFMVDGVEVHVTPSSFSLPKHSSRTVDIRYVGRVIGTVATKLPLFDCKPVTPPRGKGDDSDDVEREIPPQRVHMPFSGVFDAPHVWIEEPIVDLGVINLDVEAEATVTLRNSGHSSVKWRFILPDIFKGTSHLDEQESEFMFLPNTGVLQPNSHEIVTFSFKPNRDRRIRLPVECRFYPCDSVSVHRKSGGEREGGGGGGEYFSRYIQVHANAQSPQVCLSETELPLGQCYIQTPVIRTVTIKNLKLVPAWFRWQPIDLPSCTVNISPSTGVLQANDEAVVTVTFTPNTIGAMEVTLIGFIAGSDEPFGCTVSAAVEPIAVQVGVCGEEAGSVRTVSAAAFCRDVVAQYVVGRAVEEAEGEMDEEGERVSDMAYPLGLRLNLGKHRISANSEAVSSTTLCIKNLTGAQTTFSIAAKKYGTDLRFLQAPTRERLTANSPLPSRRRRSSMKRVTFGAKSKPGNGGEGTLVPDSAGASSVSFSLGGDASIDSREGSHRSRRIQTPPSAQFYTSGSDKRHKSHRKSHRNGSLSLREDPQKKAVSGRLLSAKESGGTDNRGISGANLSFSGANLSLSAKGMGESLYSTTNLQGSLQQSFRSNGGKRFLEERNVRERTSAFQADILACGERDAVVHCDPSQGRLDPYDTAYVQVNFYSDKGGVSFDDELVLRVDGVPGHTLIPVHCTVDGHSLYFPNPHFHNLLRFPSTTVGCGEAFERTFAVAVSAPERLYRVYWHIEDRSGKGRERERVCGGGGGGGPRVRVKMSTKTDEMGNVAPKVEFLPYDGTHDETPFAIRTTSGERERERERDSPETAVVWDDPECPETRDEYTEFMKSGEALSDPEIPLVLTFTAPETMEKKGERERERDSDSDSDSVGVTEVSGVRDALGQAHNAVLVGHVYVCEKESGGLRLLRQYPDLRVDLVARSHLPHFDLNGKHLLKFRLRPSQADIAMGTMSMLGSTMTSTSGSIRAIGDSSSRELSVTNRTTTGISCAVDISGNGFRIGRIYQGNVDQDFSDGQMTVKTQETAKIVVSFSRPQLTRERAESTASLLTSSMGNTEARKTDRDGNRAFIYSGKLTFTYPGGYVQTVPLFGYIAIPRVVLSNKVLEVTDAIDSSMLPIHDAFKITNAAPFGIVEASIAHVPEGPHIRSEFLRLRQKYPKDAVDDPTAWEFSPNFGIIGEKSTQTVQVHFTPKRSGQYVSLFRVYSSEPRSDVAEQTSAKPPKKPSIGSLAATAATSTAGAENRVCLSQDILLVGRARFTDLQDL